MVASLWASTAGHSGAPKLRVNRVRGGASGAHRPELEGIPNSQEGEDGSEDERVGADGRVDEEGLGEALVRKGPWNTRVLLCHSGSGSEVGSSYCPRRMEGSSACCLVKVSLKKKEKKKKR